MSDLPYRPRSASRPRRGAPRIGILALGAIVVALVPLASAQAMWRRESPHPTGLPVNAVAAPQPGRLFVATDDDPFDSGGALFESRDGGGTWIQRAVPSDLGSGINGIGFFDADRGWLWGNVNYRTLDGGDTWEALPPLGSTYAMQFFTPMFGLATGNFGAYTSRDGGSTWEPSPHGISAFAFSGAQTALGAAATGLFRSADGGATFAAVREGAADAVAFLSPSVAIAIVDQTLLRSTDAGATWNTGTDAIGRDRLFVVSPDVVLAWGRSGDFPDYDDRVLRSSDGGQTWTDLGEAIPSDPFAAPGGFVAVDAMTVIASDGAGNLYRSIDAGQTWTQVYATPGPRPGFIGNSVPVFADAQTGVVGFGAGFVIATHDAGATWTPLSSGVGAQILDLARFPNGDQIAVAEAGQVLTRSSEAAAWRLRATLGPSDLVAVQITGADAAVAVDASGRLHRSDDRGASWTASASTPPQVTVTDLYFEDSTRGWVVGQGFAGAALFRTVDAGASWTPSGDFQGSYVAVDFVGERGWALSAQGTLYRTGDFGDSWTDSVLTDDPVALTALDFWDADIGYAVGASGFVARSSDGGLTWQRLPTPNAVDQITDLVLLGAGELWVTTAQGKAMYSASAGQNWAVMDAATPSLGAYTSITASPGGDAWIGGWRGAILHFSGPPGPPVNHPPVAAFAFATTGLSVALTDASSDIDGSIVTRTWSFGDGTTSSETNPTHLYAGAGTYHVELTVTDDDGATDSALKFIVVQPGPGGTFGEFTEVTPLDPLFVTPQDEDFWVSAAAPADYDGDGDLDIALLGYYVVYDVSVEDRLLLLRNDGPLSDTQWNFSRIELELGDLGAGASDLAWGDVDLDGDQDLAVGSNGATVLYRNDAGALSPTDSVLPGYREFNDQADFDLDSISWADFDNDGDLDLLLPSIRDEQTFGSHTALMRNDGPNGTGGWEFVDVAAGLGASDHAQTRWADMDADQDLDLLVVHLAPLSENGFIRRFRNDGDGVFVGEDILGSVSVEHGEAQWGDYDDDGDLDVLVAGNVREADGSFNAVLRVYRNDAEIYTAIDVIACVFCEGWFDLSAATWADYDSDGDIDILLAGTYNSGSQIEGRAKIYDNVDGSFVDSGNQLPAPRAMGFSGGSFSWLDIDGDGDLDYFIAGSYFVPGGNGLVETQMHLYRNTAPAQNLAPAAPTALDAQILPDGSVRLSWDPGHDDLTPTTALTYDLRLYRGDAPATLPRRSPENGNLRGRLEWTLAGLGSGDYTWSLETVDSAYNGSDAARAGFTLGVGDGIFRDDFESP